MKYLSLVMCLFLSPLALADEPPPDYWQCYAFDAGGGSYQASDETEKDAMKAAIRVCSKQSHRGKCRSAQSFCTQIQAERCLVTDERGRSWTGTGEDGCDNALQACRRWQWLHGRSSVCNVKTPQ